MCSKSFPASEKSNSILLHFQTTGDFYHCYLFQPILLTVSFSMVLFIHLVSSSLPTFCTLICIFLTKIAIVLYIPKPWLIQGCISRLLGPCVYCFWSVLDSYRRILLKSHIVCLWWYKDNFKLWAILHFSEHLTLFLVGIWVRSRWFKSRQNWEWLKSSLQALS